MQIQTPQNRVLFARTHRTRLGRVLCAVLLLAIALSTSVAQLQHNRVQAATNGTLNFQARLNNAAGGIVPDGYYNVEFKLYNVSTGGSALWTDTRYDTNGATAGNDYRLRVANGYLTVNLADTTVGGTAFPSTINWDQDLWISMNIGGTTQTATPTWDGEMSPRLKLTSTPYAFRAGQLATFNNVSGFTSTLSIVQPTVGNQTFQIADQAAAGGRSFVLVRRNQLVHQSIGRHSVLREQRLVVCADVAAHAFFHTLGDIGGSDELPARHQPFFERNLHVFSSSETLFGLRQQRPHDGGVRL